MPTLASESAAASRARWLGENAALAESSFGRLLAENRSPPPADAPRALPLLGLDASPHFAAMRERFTARLPELRARWREP